MSPQPSRTENLALVFQELLTVGERLRCNRQPVSDSGTFRQMIWAALTAADETSRRKGYTEEDVELANFAVIAFLDESVFYLRRPIFADWAKQPLQEERYGHQRAGEIFFQNLQKLLTRTDSPQLADLLEVYYLCMLLGFLGRFSLARGELRSIMQQTADKFQRIRQTSPVLSPDAAPKGEQVRLKSGDPIVKILLGVAIFCVVAAIGLFVLFEVMLNGGIDKLKHASGGPPPSVLFSSAKPAEFSIPEERAL